MAHMEMKVGDLMPPLVVTCYDGATPVDLTAASTVQVVTQRDGVFLFKRSAIGDASGVVTYIWQAGDTDTAGLITLEVLVTWPGSKPQRFRPVDGVHVGANLG